MIKDERAVASLNGPDTVRDSLLVSVLFEHPSDDLLPSVTMIFEDGEPRARTVTLVFSGVTEFSFLYEGQSQDVAMIKCLQTDDGDFFVSLDPYDEREQFVSERDGDFVRAKHIEMTINAVPADSR